MRNTTPGLEAVSASYNTRAGLIRDNIRDHRRGFYRLLIKTPFIQGRNYSPEASSLITYQQVLSTMKNHLVGHPAGLITYLLDHHQKVQRKPVLSWRP